MGRFADVRDFAERARGAACHADLERLLGDVARELGFPFFALMHHVSDPLRYGAAHLISYPPGWVEMVAERRYWADDPVAAACQKKNAGFEWWELPEIITLSERHLEILEGARGAGVGEGYTVPANVPGELSGSVNFCVRRGRSINQRALPAAQFVALYAYEAARRIARCSIATPPPVPVLTERQYQCVILVARGKSDWEAGKILGIGKDTVHRHVQTAMKRCNVPTRTQLVVRTLFSGQLNFGDIVH